MKELDPLTLNQIVVSYGSSIHAPELNTQPNPWIRRTCGYAHVIDDDIGEIV